MRCKSPKPRREDFPRAKRDKEGFEEIKHHFAVLQKSKIGFLSHVSSQHSVLDVLYGGDVGNPMPSWTFQTTPELEVTDQQHTGRCWIFATIAVLGHIFRSQYNISNRRATFSEGYLGFWDLYEKSRLFLHVAYDTRSMSMDDPSLSDFFKLGISDGGDFIFCMNLLAKYGIVPTEYYPNSSYGSMSTEALVTLVNQILRDDAITLRRTGDKTRIPAMMTNIFTILCMGLGTPPVPWKRLDWHLDQQETMPKLAMEIPLDDSRSLLTKDDSEPQDIDVPKTKRHEDKSFESLISAIEASRPASPVDSEATVSPGDTSMTVLPSDEPEREEVTLVSGLPPRPTVEIETPPCRLRCPKANMEKPDKCAWKKEPPGIQRLVHSVRPVTEESLVFDYTPVDFYERFLTGARFVPLICDPRFPAGTRIISNDANMYGGMPSLYLNVSNEDIQMYAIESLKRNIPVWFACDVKKQLTPEGGRMCAGNDRLAEILPEKHEKGTKIEEICHYNALANHALLISAVSMKGKKPIAWRIVNSWGEVGRNAGVFVACEEWFRDHVYSINAIYDTLSSQHKKDVDSNKKHATVRLGPFDPSVI